MNINGSAQQLRALHYSDPDLQDTQLIQLHRTISLIQLHRIRSLIQLHRILSLIQIHRTHSFIQLHRTHNFIRPHRTLRFQSTSFNLSHCVNFIHKGNKSHKNRFTQSITRQPKWATSTNPTVHKELWQGFGQTKPPRRLLSIIS